MGIEKPWILSINEKERLCTLLISSPLIILNPIKKLFESQTLVHSLIHTPNCKLFTELPPWYHEYSYIYICIHSYMETIFFCDVVGISSVLSLITLPLNMSFNNTTLRLALSHENSPQKADQTETQTPIGVVKVVSTPIMWLFPRIDRRITRSLCNAIQFVICFLEIRNVNIARLQHIVHGIEATVPKENIPWP